MSNNPELETAAPSRRHFLRGMGAAAAFAGFGQAFGLKTDSSAALSHAPLLDLMATAKALSVTLYHHALTQADFGMSAETRASLGAMLAAEQEQLDLLSKLGAQPLTRQFALPAQVCGDAGCFADTALQLEKTCLDACIAASYQFAVQGKPELAATAAQLAANEAQHLTVLSQMAGFGQVRLDTAAVSPRAVPNTAALASFLSPAEGRVSMALPGKQSVAAAVLQPIEALV